MVNQRQASVQRCMNGRCKCWKQTQRGLFTKVHTDQPSDLTRPRCTLLWRMAAHEHHRSLHLMCHHSKAPVKLHGLRPRVGKTCLLSPLCSTWCVDGTQHQLLAGR